MSQRPGPFFFIFFSLLAALPRPASGGQLVLNRRNPFSGPVTILGGGALAAGSDAVFVSTSEGVARIGSSGDPARVPGLDNAARVLRRGAYSVRIAAKPRMIAADRSGNLYIASSRDNQIRRFNPETGVASPFAKIAKGIAGLAAAGDAVFVSTRGGRILLVAADHSITTVAEPGASGSLALDAHADFLYLADSAHHRVLRIATSDGNSRVIAGTGSAGWQGDGGPASNAQLNEPRGVAVDASGNIYIADSGNFRVRRIDAVTGRISTLAGESLSYPDRQHGAPASLAIGAGNILWIADLGTSVVRRTALDQAYPSIGQAPSLQATAYTISVTYDATVPAEAQAAFNSLVSTYQDLFTTTTTLRLAVNYANVGLGQSTTGRDFVTYSDWRSALMTRSAANPGNTYLASAVATLPATDPLGQGNLMLAPAYARSLGLANDDGVDTTISFTNSPGTFEYNGVSADGLYDFADTAAHELDEAMGMDSAVAAGALPTDMFAPEDYFRYNGSGQRLITNDPAAVVYFSYDGGNTLLVQYNQDPAVGDTHDFYYANDGCPALAPGPYLQDAIGCPGGVVPVGDPGSPEVIILSTLGYVTAPAGAAQTITFGALPAVTFGATPFTISATASSGLAVSFTSSTTVVCTVSGNTVTLVAPGTCTITASQAGDSTFAPATHVTQSFTVNPPANTPSIYGGGVVPVYSTRNTIQPGEWISIYGANLAPAVAVWNGDFPTTLGDVSVTIDGKPAYLWYVSSGQINLQAPDDATTGPVPVVVTTPRGTANSTVTLAPVAPALLLLADAKHVTAIVGTSGPGNSGAGYDVIGPARPVAAGEVVVLYGVGLGPVNPAVPAGQAFSGSAPVVTPVQVTVGGKAIPAENVLYAGEVSAGLYQVNMKVPSGLGTGDMPIVVTASGASTQDVAMISVNAP